MTVTAGAFTKTDCKKGTGDKQLENQTAIISLTGGTLNVSGTKTGDGYSVTMTAGGTENGGTLENVFGIRADDGGTISTTGVSFQIYGDYSAGVLSYDGKINLGNDTIITVKQSDEKKDANNNNTLLTSAGVSSEQASEGEKHPVNLSGGVTITSNGLGITARGVVNVTGGESTVTTERGTGIYVNNGEFKVDKGATINVNSTVQSGFSWTTPPESETINASNIYNGVYVQGGSLVSEGTLNVTFTGVENDAYGSGANSNLNANTAYRDFQIKSYAVRVEAAASGGKTEVSIAGGTISNSVGGGVYVGGGKVTLGVENGNTGPTVQTRGTVSYGTPMDQDGGNWNYFLPQTGGPAVKVAQSGSVSSTLTVYDGTYTAQQGDGIVTVGGTSYIHNGTFIGRDYGANSGDRAGPGASYSFKVYGGTANVYGGTFGGQENGNYINSSGAFVMGTSEVKGTANIYGGTFVVSEENTGGQAGFSVYEYGNVLVDPGKGGEQQSLGGNVIMTGLAAGLVIEGNTSNTASVEIKGGKFSSTRNNGNSDGIWYFNSNATLTISGDDTALTGFDRSGLWLETAPAIENGVTITGGTITGKQDGIYYGSNGTAANGLLISGGTITGSNGSGLNLAGAPAASGAVTISGGTITGSNHGVYYGARGAVNDGLLIEGGTITGSNGSGLYFAVNPWQNGGTNNVAIVGGTFNGKPEKKGSNQNPYYINGAISAPSEGRSNRDYDGLGRSIRLGDILKTHTGDRKVAYVEENLDWNGNTALGDNYDYSIAVTVSSLSQVTIIPYN